MCIFYFYLQQVRVFRPFFASLDLPYSVIRGETVAIPVVVFNYMNKDVDAEVTLENSDQFDFADYSNDVNDIPRRKHEIVLKYDNICSQIESEEDF